MRPSWPRLILLATILPIAPSLAHATQQVESPYGPLPVFELHSGFWINLHHTLYNLARQRLSESTRAHSGSTSSKGADSTQDTEAMQGQGPPKPIPSAKPALTAAEQRVWDDAIAFYAANYADKDLLFSTDLVLLKNQLEDFEDCDELSGRKKKSCDAGLPGNIAEVLEAAAPVYRAHFWPDHDRANRRWIARVAPLVEEQGVGLSQRLADIYQTSWPAKKIRVDVVAVANWAGAYTTLDPLRVTISSTDPRNQGNEALEVLFHEGSHGIAQNVQDAIIRECRQRGKPIPRDLWHALIFYTTGEVIKPVMSDSDADSGSDSSDSGYTPYAVREGLYRRGWSDYLRVLTRFWQPYLNGKSSFDDAIARMVSSL